MDEWLAPTFNRHAQKIWKKNKCKRMVRKIGKRTDKSYDGGAVAISLVNRDNTNAEQEEAEAEAEREKVEREERIKKNRDWRQRRQGGKSGTERRDQFVVDKVSRNKKIQQMLACVSCGETAGTGEAVYTCSKAHFCCGDCLDLDLLDQRSLEDSKLGSESGIEDDMLSWQVSVSRAENKDDEEDTISAHNQSEIGSYVRPTLDRIDFFKNTLDIRKDAITPYGDYNALDDQEESQDLSLKSCDNRDDASEEIENYNKYLDEECPPPYASSLVEDEGLEPVTLEMTLQRADTPEGEQLTWKEKFERNKKEIDFFDNTLDIRKNAIESYSDYKKDKLDFGHFEMDGSTAEEQSEDDSESETSDDDDYDGDDGESLVSECPDCGDQDWRRNAKMEKMIELFNKMMEYRNKM